MAGPSEDAQLNPVLEAQKVAREELVKKREAAKSSYRDIADHPALNDLREFIDAQAQGCRDIAATTENAHVSEKHLHMMLMADIIKTYIDNQTKI